MLVSGRVGFYNSKQNCENESANPFWMLFDLAKLHTHESILEAENDFQK